ncbi:MAG: hypothetical protein AAF533_18375, partial [Acidobacteriota bacterium]
MTRLTGLEGQASRCQLGPDRVGGADGEKAVVAQVAERKGPGGRDRQRAGGRDWRCRRRARLPSPEGGGSEQAEQARQGEERPEATTDGSSAWAERP